MYKRWAILTSNCLDLTFATMCHEDRRPYTTNVFLGVPSFILVSCDNTKSLNISLRHYVHDNDFVYDIIFFDHQGMRRLTFQFTTYEEMAEFLLLYLC